MKAGRERTLAGLAMLAIILAWFALILQIYYVPHLTALWAELGQPLSPAQRLLLTLCRLLDDSFILIAPVLLLATIAVFVWRIRAVRRERAVARI